MFSLFQRLKTACSPGYHGALNRKKCLYVLSSGLSSPPRGTSSHLLYLEFSTGTGTCNKRGSEKNSKKVGKNTRSGQKMEKWSENGKRRSKKQGQGVKRRSEKMPGGQKKTSGVRKTR